MPAHNYKSIVDRVRNRQASLKEAASKKQAPETDPNEKGTASVKQDPETTPAATNLPQQTENKKPAADPILNVTKPSDTGENVPSTTPGNPKDNVSSPTDPLSKIAGRVSGSVERLKALKAGAPKTASEEGKPEDKTKQPETTSKEAGKGEGGEGNPDDNEALAGDIQITPEFHFKLAAAILETEEGIEFAEKLLHKRAGEVAAQALIRDACIQQQAFIELGEQEKAAAHQQAQYLEVVEGMLKNASQEDQEAIVKLAQVHNTRLASIEDEGEKRAYMQGAIDGAGMEDNEGVLPGGMEDGSISIEELVELLMTLVQSGQISEEEADQILQQYAGDAAAEPTPEELAVEEEMKQASALVSKLVPGL